MVANLEQCLEGRTFGTDVHNLDGCVVWLLRVPLQRSKKEAVGFVGTQRVAL